jgi:hypothetical protein
MQTIDVFVKVKSSHGMCRNSEITNRKPSYLECIPTTRKHTLSAYRLGTEAMTVATHSSQWYLNTHHLKLIGITPMAPSLQSTQQ